MHAHRPVSHLTPSASPAISLCPALSANVLVLNKFYQAIRVINVRRAFSLLCRELAEVVHIETDASGKSQWLNLKFTDWQAWIPVKAQFWPAGYDRIHTLRFQIVVPRDITRVG